MLHFLRAEVKSELTSKYLSLEGVDPKIINEADLNSPSENFHRWRALGHRQGVLAKIPWYTKWWLARLDGEELGELLADQCYETWRTLSRGTWRLLTAAEAVRNRERFASDKPDVQAELPEQTKAIREIYDSSDGTREMGVLILVRAEEGGPLTVIEGIKRATALCWRHCLDGVPCPGIEAYVGITWYPPF